MATEIPIASPVAASAATQPARTPAVTDPLSTCAHREDSAMVKPIASAARAGSAAPRTPGSGTKISAPPTRASASRKPYSVPVESARLTGIAAQVPEYGNGVRPHLLQQPG